MGAPLFIFLSAEKNEARRVAGFEGLNLIFASISLGASGRGFAGQYVNQSFVNTLNTFFSLGT